MRSGHIESCFQGLRDSSDNEFYVAAGHLRRKLRSPNDAASLTRCSSSSTDCPSFYTIFSFILSETFPGHGIMPSHGFQSSIVKSIELTTGGTPKPCMKGTARS